MKRKKDPRLALFVGCPYGLKKKTLNLIDRQYLSLNDAFAIVCCDYAVKGSRLWWAWYLSDFREFIPSAYIPEYLNFDKYPLRYIETAPGVFGHNPYYD